MLLRSRAHPATVAALYLVSGAVSLGYQVCWFRIFVEAFGSTSLTFALVVSNFIGGLGVGALLSRPLTERLAARTGLDDPLRLYGALELAVAGTAALTLLFRVLPADAFGSFPWVLEDGIWQLGLAHRAAKAAATTALVFVPCLLMGVTFPLLCHAFRERPRFPSGLYAANTAGACSGVLLCEFVLFPSLGHGWAFALCLAANAGLGCACLWGAVGRPASAPGPAVQAAGPAAADRRAPAAAWPALLVLAVLGGLLTGGLESDVLRRIRFTGFRSEAAMSFISFWAVLAIFLGSLAVRWSRGPGWRGLRVGALAAALLYLGTWEWVFAIEDLVTRALGAGAAAVPADAPGSLAALYRRHASLLPTLAFVGLAVFPAFFLLAWLLPFACDRLQAQGRHLGLAYGLNTLAFCAGVLAFGQVAPRVDVFYSTQLFGVLLVVGAGVVATLPIARPPGAVRLASAGAAALLAIALVPRGLDPGWFQPGDPARTGKVSALRGSADTTTFVVDGEEGRHLYFDAFSMSATTPGAQRYMRLMAHWPLLAQPDPKSALVICFGVGNTASAAAAHAGLERIDVVDLNRDVFRTAPEFGHANRLVYRDPRVRLVHDDGRHWLALTQERYDLVTSEPPPPRHEGVHRLYSVEYYRDALARLTERGMMTQWLTVRQMPPEAVELAIRSFVSVFPHTLLYVGAQYDFVLLGSPSPIELSTLERRFAESPRARADLERIGVKSALALLARVVQSDAQLRASVGEGRVLSDTRNDWSYAFFSDARAPVLRFDPVELWAQVGLEGLENGPALRRLSRNLGLLRSHVQDFPLATLMSVREAPSAGQVRWADADWRAIHALNRRALVAEAAGDAEEAVRLFRDSLARVPDQLYAWISLAEILEARGDPRGAAEAWRELATRMPEDGWARYRLGRALLAAERPREAVEALVAAREREPRNATLEAALAEAFARAGRESEARAARRRAALLEREAQPVPWTPPGS